MLSHRLVGVAEVIMLSFAIMAVAVVGLRLKNTEKIFYKYNYV